MMTDRELLELAAKAAGYEPSRVTDDGMVLLRGIVVRWSPLTDDGDALRLMVGLGLGIEFGEHEVWCHEQCQQYEWAEHKGDKNSATRRAIVRAAAEIGRSI